MRCALFALCAAGCSVSGTGVMLHIAAPPGLAPPTSLDVAASYDGATIHRMVALGPNALPGALLAELPDRDLSVTFELSATPAGHALTPAIAVAAHHVVDLDVTLTAPGNGDGGSDGGSDGGMPFFTQPHGGIANGAISGLWAASSGGATYASCVGCPYGLLYSADGMSWGTVAATSNATVRGVWGVGTTVYAVGDTGTLWQGSGTSFTSSTISTAAGVTLNAVWGTGSDLFIAGDNNTILHFTGGGWVSENLAGTTQLQGVWGTSATDVYVVGYGGTIFHKTSAAASWPAETSHTTSNLYSVGGSAGDIYAVGDNVIVRSSGGGIWSATTRPEFLAHVQAATPTDVWMVGGPWAVLRGAGASFTTIPTGQPLAAPNGLHALFVFPSGEAFLGGDKQIILHHQM